MALKDLTWMEEEGTDDDGNTVLLKWCEEGEIVYEDDCSNIYSKGACL